MSCAGKTPRTDATQASSEDTDSRDTYQYHARSGDLRSKDQRNAILRSAVPIGAAVLPHRSGHHECSSTREPWAPLAGRNSNRRQLWNSGWRRNFCFRSLHIEIRTLAVAALAGIISRAIERPPTTACRLRRRCANPTTPISNGKHQLCAMAASWDSDWACLDISGSATRPCRSLAAKCAMLATSFVSARCKPHTPRVLPERPLTILAPWQIESGSACER